MAGTDQLLSNIKATLLQLVADLGEPSMRGNENVDTFYARYGFKEGIDPSKVTDGDVPVLIAHLAEWADRLRPKHIDALIKEQEAIMREADKGMAKQKALIPTRFRSERRQIEKAQARATQLKTALDTATASGDASAITEAQRNYQEALEEYLHTKAAKKAWMVHARSKKDSREKADSLRKQKAAITKVSNDLLALQASVQAVRAAADIDEKRKKVLAFKQRVLQIALIVEQLLR